MPALESRSAVLESCRWDELEPLGFAPAESVAAITCVELRVPCGSPSPIGEGSVGKVDLSRMLVKNPLATFLVRCTGTAMTAAGIEFGDVCIVDRSLDARSGDIVLAYINARFTMRRYEEYGEDGRRLVPVAKEGVHPVTEITDKDDFNIEGVVTGLCRKPLRRAEAVKAYLAEKGIALDKLASEGRGESFKYNNGTEEGRQQNRRVELHFEQ